MGLGLAFLASALPARSIGIGIGIPEQSYMNGGAPMSVGFLLLVGGGNILLVGKGKLKCSGAC